MYTTVRVSIDVKKKAEGLKGKISFDSYISKMNTLVEMQNIDLDDIGENIPKLIKERVGAQIKILRAFEKQYLIPTKRYLELLHEEKQTDTNQAPVIGTKSQELENLRSENQRLKTELEAKDSPERMVPTELKNDLLRHIHEIKSKGKEVNRKNEHEVVYSSFFLTQKLDIIINKINAL